MEQISNEYRAPALRPLRLRVTAVFQLFILDRPIAYYADIEYSRAIVIIIIIAFFYILLMTFVTHKRMYVCM